MDLTEAEKEVFSDQMESSADLSDDSFLPTEKREDDSMVLLEETKSREELPTTPEKDQELTVYYTPSADIEVVTEEASPVPTETTESSATPSPTIMEREFPVHPDDDKMSRWLYNPFFSLVKCLIPCLQATI